MFIIKNSLSALTISLLLLLSFSGCKKLKEINPINPVGSGSGSSSNSKPTFAYIIKTNENVVDASKLNIKPGSFIGIQGGTRSALKLLNFKGTKDSIITFLNIGKVVVQGPTTNSYGINTRDCAHIKFSGKGDPSVTYGIEVDGGNIGISFDHLSTDLEMENVEVHGTGFCGVMAKTDPSCTDSSTWRGNFTMRNISFHNNYIHDTGSEGFYIGNSFYADGENTSCGTLYPHAIEGVEVYKNHTQNTGAEGIQVGAAISGCKVHDNVVENFGVSPFANYQNNGIQIGGGTGGLCYNNLVKTGAGNGIIVLGLGDNVVFNNIVLDAAADGVFCDSRLTPGSAFKFYNNTIINCGRYGFNFYSETIPMNYAINNMIINPGGGEYIHVRSSLVKLTASNNYTNNDVTAAKFIDFLGLNFHLRTDSPLLGKGKNIANCGFSYDFYNSTRPSSCSIGATE